MNALRNFARMDKDAARREWSDRFNNRMPGPRKPGNVAIKAALNGATEIMLYDEIGFWGVTAKEFNDRLAAITSRSILVRINSPGGDVFDGLAIYSALKQHPAEITCQVDGLAASAASFIALAGEKTIMSENALMMTHCAWGLAIGNKSDMLETAMILEKIDGQLADIYAKKTGKTPAECMAMMAGEGKNDGTWFTALEACDFGLIDELMPADEGGDELEQKAMAGRGLAMKRRLALVERE